MHDSMASQALKVSMGCTEDHAYSISGRNRSNNSQVSMTVQYMGRHKPAFFWLIAAYQGSLRLVNLGGSNERGHRTPVKQGGLGSA